jgi:hypothetical protein
MWRVVARRVRLHPARLRGWLKDAPDAAFQMNADDLPILDTEAGQDAPPGGVNTIATD